jgi:catechol 2,3-dioxygenase-like lactoylglutathione lyase family enzyme
MFKSIQPFIGARDFETSRRFYSDLGFAESILSAQISYFERFGLGFYLQAAYVKDWVENTMIFIEVEDVYLFWEELLAMELPSKYKNVRLVPVKELAWGRECFLHDPSGVLWHFGEFGERD